MQVPENKVGVVTKSYSPFKYDFTNPNHNQNMTLSRLECQGLSLSC